MPSLHLRNFKLAARRETLIGVQAHRFEHAVAHRT
jgi:hypothetical protein